MEELRKLIIAGKVPVELEVAKYVVKNIAVDKTITQTVARSCTDKSILTRYADLFEPEYLAQNPHAIEILDNENYICRHWSDSSFRRALTNNVAAASLFKKYKLTPEHEGYCNRHKDMLPTMLGIDYTGKNVTDVLKTLSDFFHPKRSGPAHEPRFNDDNLVELVKKLLLVQEKNIYVPGRISNYPEYDYLWTYRIDDLSEESIREILMYCKRRKILDLVAASDKNIYFRVRSKL